MNKIHFFDEFLPVVCAELLFPVLGSEMGCLHLTLGELSRLHTLHSWHVLHGVVAPLWQDEISAKKKHNKKGQINQIGANKIKNRVKTPF